MPIDQIYGYLMHLATGFALVGVFVMILRRAFLLLKSILSELKSALEANNIAMGTQVGAVSLSVDLINRTRLS